jgi:hypothetical protein
VILKASLSAADVWSVTGSIRQRGANSWELRVYGGTDTGRRRWATMRDRLLWSQGGTHDVDVRSHPECGVDLGLSGQACLRLQGGDGQSTGGVREHPSNRRTVIDPIWGRSGNRRRVIAH